MKQIFAAAMLLALAGCQQGNDDNIAIDETNGAKTEIEILPPDEGNDQTAEANAIAPPTVPIPAAFHGRWGMTPGDCTSTRGDAKGLINVTDDKIRFYESTATLKEQRPAIATSFSGLFSFTGEGQTWEKVMTFTRSGNTLSRAENEGNFTYKRC